MIFFLREKNLESLGRKVIVLWEWNLKLSSEGVFSSREFNDKTCDARQTHPANRYKKTGGNRKKDSLSCLSSSVLVIILRLVKCLIARRGPKE